MKNKKDKNYIFDAISEKERLQKIAEFRKQKRRRKKKMDKYAKEIINRTVMN